MKRQFDTAKKSCNNSYLHCQWVVNGRRVVADYEPKLLELVTPNTAGDPMSSRKWLICRLQDLQERLGKHRVSARHQPIAVVVVQSIYTTFLTHPATLNITHHTVCD